MEHLHVKRLVIMVCAIQPALAGNPEIRKLKTKVDFFLDNMMDVTQNFQEIRDDVTSLQERLNASVSCDPALCVASTENEPSTETHAEMVALETGDTLEARMIVIHEAFKDEKALLRIKGQLQDDSIATIAKTVTDVKVELAEDVALVKSEISNTIADMNSKLNKTLSTVAKVCMDLTNEIQSVDQKLSDEIQQHDAGIKALNAKVEVLLGIEGIVRYGTSIYKVHNDLMSWDAAQAKCQKEGFYLAEIDNAEEHEFVRMLGEKTSYWVGGSDKSKEGVWRWVNSGRDVDLTLFRTGEPNNSGNEDCMHNYGTERTGHNDRACYTTQRFVCEKESNWP